MTTRELTWVAIFGALWGALEISLGTWLHALHVPLKGLIMSVPGLTVALAGRRVIARNGSVIGIAAIAAALKGLSFGGIVLPPLVAILIQGAIAELVTLGRPGRWRLALAGALAVCWSVFHPIVGQGLLAGTGIYSAWLTIIERALDALGISPALAWAAVVAIVALHLAAGALAGLLGDAIAAGALRRLGAAEANDEH